MFRAPPDERAELCSQGTPSLLTRGEAELGPVPAWGPWGCHIHQHLAASPGTGVRSPWGRVRATQHHPAGDGGTPKEAGRPSPWASCTLQAGGAVPRLPPPAPPAVTPLPACSGKPPRESPSAKECDELPANGSSGLLALVKNLYLSGEFQFPATGSCPACACQIKELSNNQHLCCIIYAAAVVHAPPPSRARGPGAASATGPSWARGGSSTAPPRRAPSWPSATAQPTELCPSLGTHGDALGQGTVLSRVGRGGGCVAQTWHLGVPLAAPHPRSAGCPPHSSILCPSSPRHPPRVPRAPSSVGPPLQELLINVNWEQPRSTGGKSL